MGSAEQLAHAEQLFALGQLDDAFAATRNVPAARDAAVEQQVRLADRFADMENLLVGRHFKQAAGDAQLVERLQGQAGEQLGAAQQLALRALGDIKSGVQAKNIP